MTDYKLVPAEPTQEMIAALKDRIGVTNRGGLLNAGNALAHAIAAAPAVQGEPVDELRFEYRHTKTGETYTVSLSREEVAEQMEQELFDKLTARFCGCEPVGETYVVDCGCDEYADQFELVTTPQPAPPTAKVMKN